MRRSQLQKQVLSLYKACHRAAQAKPNINPAIIRTEFKKNSDIPRTESMRIEHLLRQGNRKLKLLRDPHVTQLGNFV